MSDFFHDPYCGAGPRRYVGIDEEHEPRRMTPEERIEARHWLQELSEHAKTVRNAMDPQHGVLNITDQVWAAQWAALRKHLDDFTERVMANKPAAGGVGDRNA